jgi:hypothetical protein
MRLLVLALASASLTAYAAAWELDRRHLWSAATRLHHIYIATGIAAAVLSFGWWASWVAGMDPWTWVRGLIAVAFWLGLAALGVAALVVLRERQP